jgi:hypothetical protein
MYKRIHEQYPLFFSDFNESWTSSTDFFNNTQISDFIKIRPMEAEIYRADGRTDTHDESNSRFPQICERASKSTGVLISP